MKNFKDAEWWVWFSAEIGIKTYDTGEFDTRGESVLPATTKNDPNQFNQGEGFAHISDNDEWFDRWLVGFMRNIRPES
jgi:hypothetical protein